MGYVETGEIQRLMIRAPRGWGGSAAIAELDCHS